MTHLPGDGAAALVHDVQSRLTTKKIGRPLQWHGSVASTNTMAARWAADGAPEGASVMAEFQTDGRGRLGRTWQARAGLNLTLSVVLRPVLPPERLGLITLAAGVAVADTISVFCRPVEANIKWPNDVLIEGRKVCGMLLETAFQRPAAPAPAVILGIGINVNQDTFPPTIAANATSLLLATGRPVPRAPLLAALFGRLEERYDSLFADGGLSVREAYLRRLHGLGGRAALRLTGTDHVIRGTICDVTENGALQLRTDEGMKTFHAGEVTTEPRGADAHSTAHPPPDESK